jgi:hypothetical protein
MREAVAGTVSAQAAVDNSMETAIKNNFFIYVFFKTIGVNFIHVNYCQFLSLKQKYATLKKYSKIKDIYFVLLIRMQRTALVSKTKINSFLQGTLH